MANEALLKLRIGDPINFIVSNSTGIEKGTICKMADPRTASASTGTGDVFGGIAASEKIASDGRVQLGLARRGIYGLKCNAGTGVTIGEWVTSSGANLVRTATEAEIAAGKAIGIALETAGVNDVFEVMVGGF
jgi:hypothetical protein